MMLTYLSTTLRAPHTQNRYSQTLRDKFFYDSGNPNFYTLRYYEV